MPGSRLWVLQEATAARTNTCLYGSAAIELSTVLTVALWIEHKYNHLPMSLYMTDGVKDGIELWEFVDSEHGEFRQGTSVGEALRIAQGLQTAQAEDKVFGILGLLKCVRSNSEGAIPKLLQPDYRKGFAAVYRDAARFALHENVTELDEVLGCIMHRSREELDDINHLSWVPRWDRPTNSSLDTAPIPVGKGRSACDEVSFPGDPATGTDPDTLYLHGILFSSAEQVAPLFDFRNDDVVHNQEWQRVVLEIINKCNRTDDDGMDRMLSTVLVAESSPDSRYADKLRTAAFQTCWAFVTEHGRLPKAADLTDHDTHSAHTAEEFAVDFFQACDQRRIFRTVNGRPGVGPKVMEGGDLITVLYGCQAAYVLRQYGEYYRIVGDCYVYGIMQGQAVREHKELGRSSTVFSIR